MLGREVSLAALVSKHGLGMPCCIVGHGRQPPIMGGWPCKQPNSWVHRSIR